VTTVADVDVQLGAAYWKLLHARWEDRTFQAQTLSDEIDALLAERYRLAGSHGGAFRARARR